MKIFIKRLTDVPIPKYQRAGDAAIDLHAAKDILVPAGKQVIVPTGIALAIPEGHAGLIWDRGGMAAKHHLHCLAGVVDSNYRGEIQVVLRNLGEEDFTITKHMRVAQMLLQKVEQASFEEVDELDSTERNEGRFSSSGY